MESAEKQKTILLVEDETIIAITEKMTLEKYGYLVITANTGEEAVEVIAKTPGIDLILMDINLGTGLDGTETAARILKNHDLPVVFLSSHTEPEVVAKTERITSYGYVVKNSSATVLDASIKMAFKLFAAKISERKKEEALEQSYDLLTKLARLVPGVIYQYRLDPDGHSAFPYASPGMNDIYEVTPEEVREDATPVFGRLHPDDYDMVAGAIQASALTLKTFYCEFRVLLPRQGLRWRWSQAHPERLADGGTLWHGIISDITERKLAEEALRASEERYRAIFDFSPYAILLTAPDGGVLTVNAATCRLFEMTEEEIKGRGRNGLLDVSDPRLPLALAERERTGQFNGELTFIRKNGSRFAGAVSTGVFKDKDGNPRTSMIIKDITDKQQVEQALRESMENFKGYFNMGAIGACVTSLEMGWIEVNDRLCRMLGYAREELLRLTWTEMTHPDDLNADLSLFNQVLAGQRDSYELEKRFIRKDGQTIHTLLYVSCQRNPDRSIHHFLASLVDISELKRAGEALRQSEARAQALLNAIPDMLFRVNRQGVFLDYKADIKDLYAQSEPNLIGKSCRDVLPPEFVDLIDLKIHATLETGALQTFEYRLPVPGRDWRDYEARMAASGVDEVTAIIRDITESKQANKALRESEERFRNILFSMADWVWEMNENGVYTFSSEKGEILLGVSRKNIIGKSPFDFMPAEEAARVAPIFAEISTRKGIILDLENWNIGRNGERICLLTNGVPILDEMGNLKGYRGVDKDITERKRAEEALRLSEAKQSNALQMTKSGHWEYDVDRDLFTFNDNFYRIFRTTADAVGGYQISSGEYARRFCHPDDAAQVGEETLGAITSPDPNYSRQIEHRILYADGEVGFMAVRFFIVKDAQGRTVKTYGVNQDITERKRAEDEIQRQLTEKEILLKEVHHRIKNNVASIGGLISLRLQSITNPEAVAVLQETVGRVDSMRILYDKLLLTKGYEVISVKNYVESLIDAIVALFPGSAKVTVNKRIADFHLDAKRLFPLGLIINELITNKMKYAFSGRDTGKIRIALKKVDKQVKLIIEDNGNSLPDEFDINQSTGFGLTLVKMLSQQLGGNFLMEKRAGTRCTVEFII